MVKFLCWRRTTLRSGFALGHASGYVPAGEIIIFHGEFCEQIYLIEEGEVEVVEIVV
jgi:CRP-like cAMP-binding protein